MLRNSLLKHALLLLLDAAAGLQRQANDPLQILVGHRHFRIGEQQLQQSADRLVTASISRPLRAPPRWTRPCMTDAVSGAKPAPALAEEVAHQTEMVCEVLVGFSFGKSQPGA